MRNKPNQYKFIASSVAMVLLLPACSNSISTKPGTAISTQSAFFEHFDTNKDQKVTADEFILARSGRFKKDDKDGNGVLSRREYIQASLLRSRARKKEQKLEYFASIDTDNDGTVSKKEFIASSEERAKKYFANLDKDNSGSINNEEFAFFRYIGEQNSMRRQTDPFLQFMEMDLNRDTQLTQEERNTARMKWFDSMDKNGDKVVTPAEVMQAKEQRAKKKVSQGK